MPTWFALGILSAFSSSFSLLVGKRLSSKIDPLVATCLGYTFSVIFQIIILFSFSSWPSFSPEFLILIIGSACLDAAALTATMYALRRSPLSLLSPVSAFTPLFAVLAAFLLLHQSPSWQDLTGIVLIVTGAYGLNFEAAQRNIFKPFFKLLSHRGVQCMLLASVIQGISPIVQHRAIYQIHPMTALAASIVSFSLVLVILWPFALQRLHKGVRIKKEHIKLSILFGAIASIVTVSGWTALGKTNPSYVVAIGRTSILFGMLWGAWFLRERISAFRLCSGMIMLGGVVLMAL
jgi:drug/metabolite transporter (DMT)-like permease